MIKLFIASFIVFTSIPALADYEIVGIGIAFGQTKNKTFQIQEIIPKAPADRAGLKVGEFILAVDGARVTGMKLDKVANMIKGPEGTSVTLEVATSAETSSTRNVTMLRERIYVKEECLLQGSLNLTLNGYEPHSTPTMVSGWVGTKYIRLNVFGNTVHGFIDGVSIYLRYSSDINMSRQSIEGFIKKHLCQWTGYNGYINGYQSCVK